MIVYGLRILVFNLNLGVAGVGHALGGDDRVDARQLLLLSVWCSGCEGVGVRIEG